MSNPPFASADDPRKQNEEIAVPGMIVRNAGAAKKEKTKIRVKLFSIGPEDDGTLSSELEMLLNRDDVVFLDYHKFTFQHTIHYAITYSEPLLKESKKESDA